MAINTQGGRTLRRRQGHPAVWATAAALLLLPAIAMRFPGSGVHWTAGDFVAMGLLLALACGGWELAARMSGNAMSRAGFAVALLGALGMTWVNLAVGLVGDGGDAANVLLMGVPVFAIVASVIARGRDRAMVRAMVATAAVQVAIGIAAALAGWGEPHDGPARVIAITACFAMPWLLSAALFHLAGTRRGAH